MKRFLEKLSKNKDASIIKPLGNQKRAWLQTLGTMVGCPIIVQKFCGNKLEESKVVLVRKVYANHAVCDIPLYDLQGLPNGTLSYNITFANLISGTVVVTELEAGI